MIDPERLSRRSSGLAAELLRAAADEQPNEHGVQQTLLALGVSGVILSQTGAAAAGGAHLANAISSSAVSGGVELAGASGVKAVSALLIVKWVGIGVLGGLGLAGVAAVTTRPPARAAVTHAPTAALHTARATTSTSASKASPMGSEPAPAVVAPTVAEVAASSAPPRAVAMETHAAVPPADMGALLAAEVAYVDRARALLAAGQSSRGLALLADYEREFHEPRLLPEVLFLQLEAYERAGRGSDARRAAQRLVSSFPASPHAGRARKLLSE